MQKPDRADLMRAYNEHIERYGRGAAVEVVETVSGTMFVNEVPEDKIVATAVALAKPRRPLRAVKAAASRSASVQDTLNAMAAALYARKS